MIERESGVHNGSDVKTMIPVSGEFRAEHRSAKRPVDQALHIQELHRQQIGGTILGTWEHPVLVGPFHLNARSRRSRPSAHSCHAVGSKLAWGLGQVPEPVLKSKDAT